MLLLIIVKRPIGLAITYLNTSNVTVNHSYQKPHTDKSKDLNTSNVTVNHHYIFNNFLQVFI